MTNQEIILNERIELVKAGLIAGDENDIITLTKPNGEIEEIPFPENIYTFMALKNIGYKVKKGQKAICKIRIWKHTTKKESIELKDGTKTEEEIENMFKTTAAFFTIGQCEPIEA